MIRLSLKNRILMVTTGAFMLTLLIIGLIILPAAYKVKNLEKYIIQTEQETENNYQLVTLLKKSINQLEEVTKTTERFRQFTVSKETDLDLIKLFEELAETHNITQNLNIQYVPPPNNNATVGIKNGGYYLFTFRNSGSFQNQIKYLRAIEDFPLYLIINQLTWSKEGKSADNPGPVILNFTGKIYTRD